MRHQPARRALSALTLGLLTLGLCATEGAAQAPAPQRDRDGMPQIPPAGPGRIGARVERLRLTLPVDPAVVIVPSTDAYIDAIERWSVDHRFPVLIDDGTPSARENIGRFVRAFEPDEVLLWEGTRKGGGSGEARIDNAWMKAWGADTYESVREVWDGMSIQPPGVVVTAEGDPAWPAALALAAGRGQPILWVDRKRGRIGGVDREEFYQRFEGQVREGIGEFGYTWARIGDDLDAITVCMNMPTRVWAPGKENDEVVALTDRLGRYNDGRIYAWTGVIVGNEAESAYRAMCSLFLQPSEFWLFNGYTTRPPLDGYTVYPVEEALRRMDYDVTAHHPPRTSVQDWRDATKSPLSAGFIHVNSSGHRGWFELNPGRAQTSDIPLLDKPAAVTLIHSFSAQDIDDRDSIARRWLDNGAYAVVGSVDEPFVQGFTPPTYLFQGLFAPVPLGVMVRPNSDKPWKINTLGDPLITLGPRAKRTDRVPNLPGAKSLDEQMKESLKANEYAEGLTRLVMLGRHDDAARLGKALFAQDVGAITPEVAEILLGAFHRTGRPDLLSKCYMKLPEAQQRDTIVIDMLWKSVGPVLDTTRNEEILDVMTANVRHGTFVEDVTAVANALRRLRGDAAALAFLTRLARDEQYDDDQRRFARRQMDRIDPSGG